MEVPKGEAPPAAEKEPEQKKPEPAEKPKGEEPTKEERHLLADDEEYKLPDFDEDDYDPVVVESVRKLYDGNKRLAKENATLYKTVDELQSVVNQVQERLQAEDFAKVEASVDHGFSLIADDYEDKIGQGSTAQYPEGTPEGDARRRVIGDAAAMASAARERGEPFSIEDLIQRAARAAFGEGKKSEQKRHVESRQGQFLHRPSARKGSERSPEERALQRSREFDREFESLVSSNSLDGI